jgi:hypothetical protein
MSNSQDIEARLCDYIEGELSDAQRAEIQRHLDAHPEHRQMIEELMRTRNLLRDLPRAKAPAELNEGLHGQLERAMLLGDDLDASTASTARRVSHMALIAATLFLAIGLAGAIYAVLRATSNRGELTQVTPQNSVTTTIAGNQHLAAPPTTLPAIVAVQAPTTQKSDSALTLVPAARKDESDAISTVPTTQPAMQQAMLSSTSPTTQPGALAAKFDEQLRPMMVSSINNGFEETGAAPMTSDYLVAYTTVEDYLGLSDGKQVVNGPATQPSVLATPTTLPTVVWLLGDRAGSAPGLIVRNLTRQKAIELEDRLAKQNVNLGFEINGHPANAAAIGGFGGGGGLLFDKTKFQPVSGMMSADVAIAKMPATQPSAPATQPSDDRVDLVILVKKVQPTVAAVSTRPSAALVNAGARPTTAPVAGTVTGGYSNNIVNESSGNDRK